MQPVIEQALVHGSDLHAPHARCVQPAMPSTCVSRTWPTRVSRSALCARSTRCRSAGHICACQHIAAQPAGLPLVAAQHHAHAEHRGTQQLHEHIAAGPGSIGQPVPCQGSSWPIWQQTPSLASQDQTWSNALRDAAGVCLLAAAITAAGLCRPRGASAATCSFPAQAPHIADCITVTTDSSSSSSSSQDQCLRHHHTWQQGSSSSRAWLHEHQQGSNPASSSSSSSTSRPGQDDVRQLQQQQAGLVADHPSSRPQAGASSSSSSGRGRSQRGVPMPPLAAVSVSVGEGDNAIMGALVATQEWVVGRLAYSLQVLSTKGIGMRIMLVLIGALPLIAVGGWAYHRASGLGLRESLYKVYALLYRVPGIGLAKEANLESYVIANAVFFAGLFTFAVFLGIVSDDIKNSFKSVRNGNYPVRTSGHVLVLNWNDKVAAIVRQFAAANQADRATGAAGGWAPWSRRSRPIVILSELPKAVMDDQVLEVLRDRDTDLEIHTRQGNPFKMSDLRKVAAPRADIVVLLHPEGVGSPASAEAIKAAAAMALTAVGSHPAQRVVVQAPGETPACGEVLSSLSASAAPPHRKFQMLNLPDRKLMQRLVAQTAAQPGILTAWLDILALAATSAQLRCVEVPKPLVGAGFGEVRRSYLHAVVCGLLTPEGQVAFNPPDSALVRPGSQLILLGKGGTLRRRPVMGNTIYTDAAKAAEARWKQERTYKSKPRQILVAGWPEALVPELQEGFSMFTPQGSNITFLLTKEPPEEWPSRLGSCKFNYVVTSNPTNVKVLLDAGIKGADAVVLGEGAPGASDMESDARVLAGLLQVQQAVFASKRRTPPHLVASIRRYGTSRLAAAYIDTLLAEAAEQAADAAAAAAAAAAASSGGLGGEVGAAAGAGSGSSGSSGSVIAATGGGAASGVAAATAGSASSTAAGTGSSTSSSSSSSSSSSTSAATTAAAAAAAGVGGCELAANILRMPEFLVPNDVISAIITQVVAEPSYVKVMGELLFSHHGQELYLRNPASFNIPFGVPITFAELAETVRLTKQTALGYIRGSGSPGTRGTLSAYKVDPASGGGAAVLGPHALHEVVFEEHDRIVVLAEEF